MNFVTILLLQCLVFAFVCDSIVFPDNWTRSNRKWRLSSGCSQTSGEHFVVNLHHFNLVFSPPWHFNVSTVVTIRQRGVNYRVSAVAASSVNRQCFVSALCCQENTQLTMILGLCQTLPWKYCFCFTHYDVCIVLVLHNCNYRPSCCSIDLVIFQYFSCRLQAGPAKSNCLHYLPNNWHWLIFSLHLFFHEIRIKHKQLKHFRIFQNPS